MAMTIDEAITNLMFLRLNPTGDKECELEPEAKELFDVAIETMRKYQIMQSNCNTKQNNCPDKEDITEEQFMTYLRRRNLVAVTHQLYKDMYAAYCKTLI